MMLKLIRVPIDSHLTHGVGTSTWDSRLCYYRSLNSWTKSVFSPIPMSHSINKLELGRNSFRVIPRIQSNFCSTDQSIWFEIFFSQSQLTMTNRTKKRAGMPVNINNCPAVGPKESDSAQSPQKTENRTNKKKELLNIVKLLVVEKVQQQIKEY